MQLSAMNSVSFQGNNAPRIRKSSEPVKFSSKEANQKIQDAQNKVHLLTVALSTATAATAIVKGKNLVALATKAIATTGEAISKGAVKAGTSAINVVKKKGTPVSGEKAINNIEKAANFLRNENPKTNTKIVSGIKDFTSKILGNEKGSAIASFVEKNNLTDPVSLAQATGATAIGLTIANTAADKVEGALDKRDLKGVVAGDDDLSLLKTLIKVADGIGGV